MKKTNWIILASKDRGINYGVGTFIRHLSNGLKLRADIQVIILEIGITGKKWINLNEKDGITVFEIPLEENKKGVDSKSNQEKIARNISRIVSMYVSKYENNIIHANYLFQHFIAVELKNVLIGKLIFTQHILPHDDNPAAVFYDTEKQTYAKADRIIAVTNQGKQYLIEKGAVEEKIKVVYNGIDPSLFQSSTVQKSIREKYGLKNESKIILYSGRLDSGKGLRFLFESFKRVISRHQDCRLVLAGDGNYRELIELSRSFSFSVSYLGFIPFEDLVALYHEAEIGVIPSLDEQCSYVALEMLFCGLPVVASSVGGLKEEIFVHNENALLTKMVPDTSTIYGIAPDVEQMAEQIITLISDKKMRKRFSENAKRHASQYFTDETMIENYIQIINKI